MDPREKLREMQRKIGSKRHGGSDASIQTTMKSFNFSATLLVYCVQGLSIRNVVLYLYAFYWSYNWVYMSQETRSRGSFNI